MCRCHTFEQFDRLLHSFFIGQAIGTDLFLLEQRAKGVVGLRCIKAAHIALCGREVAMSQNILDSGTLGAGFLSNVSKSMATDVGIEWLSKKKQTGEDKT